MKQELLEIESAWRLIQESIRPLSTESVDLRESVGRVVAESVVATSDSPPFSKSLVDGVALAEWHDSSNDYEVVETVTAGNVPQCSISGLKASRIMTGSPVPQGAIGIVMVEETEPIGNDKVRIKSSSFKTGQNILPKGRVVESGAILLNQGATIEPHHVGTLAEFGLTPIKVVRRPKTAILATGDELVPVEQVPDQGQIRNSNGPLLAQLAESMGATVTDLGVGRDEKDDLLERIKRGVKGDILVIAGGVSAGVLDLIPQCLAECGVSQVFHKINLKPGKPMWFGKTDQGCLVFGLPGNPVSSMVCFKLFVESAIRWMSGVSDNSHHRIGVLAEDFSARGGRRTFWPARVKHRDGVSSIQMLDWKGSSDQVTFLEANALVDLGKNNSGELPAGTRLNMIML